MIKKYRKLPVVIEAVIWDNTEESFSAIRKMNASGLNRKLVVDYLAKKVGIDTLEGMVTGDLGDYIIKGISGECYPCKPDIFLKSYEVVE